MGQGDKELEIRNKPARMTGRTGYKEVMENKKISLIV